MRVLKWVIGINDEPWAIGSGDVVLVGQQEGSRLDPGGSVVNDRLQVWTVEPDEGGGTRYVRAFSTGQHLPEHTDPWGGSHIGSVISGEFVWHVFEVDAPDMPSAKP